MSDDKVFRKLVIKYISENSKDIGSVARLIGVDNKTVSRWISGEVSPHQELLGPLCKIIESDIINSANNSDT